MEMDVLFKRNDVSFLAAYLPNHLFFFIANGDYLIFVSVIPRYNRYSALLTDYLGRLLLLVHNLSSVNIKMDELKRRCK